MVLGLKAALTYSDNRQRVRQKPTGAWVEASSIKDAEIETKDSAEAALELVHPAVLMELHLVIYLSFSKCEGRDQMSPEGKPRFIFQTWARLRTTQEEHLLLARVPAI